MNKIQVKRVTLTGDKEEIEFDNNCGKYLVKNFTDSDIYVCLDSDATTNDSIKIASKCGQVVVSNEYLGGLTCYKTKKIYITGTGEVEVQQLCYN